MAAEGCAERLLQDRCAIEMMSVTVLVSPTFANPERMIRRAAHSSFSGMKTSLLPDGEPSGTVAFAMS